MLECATRWNARAGGHSRILTLEKHARVGWYTSRRCRREASAALLVLDRMAEETERDHYDILGVPTNASSTAVKKAFRAAALEHHPDKGGDAAVFQTIQNVSLESFVEIARTERRPLSCQSLSKLTSSP